MKFQRGDLVQFFDNKWNHRIGVVIQTYGDVNSIYDGWFIYGFGDYDFYKELSLLESADSQALRMIEEIWGKYWNRGSRASCIQEFTFSGCVKQILKIHRALNDAGL